MVDSSIMQTDLSLLSLANNRKTQAPISSLIDKRVRNEFIDFTKVFPNSNLSSSPFLNQDDLFKMEFELFLSQIGINPILLNSNNLADCLGIFNFSKQTLPQFSSYLNTPAPLRFFQDIFDRYDSSINTEIYSDKFSNKKDLAQLQKVYNPQLSKKLASIAHQNADRTSTLGWCAKGVMDSLQISGLDKKGETRVAAAWMAVDTLSNSKNFQRVNIESRKDLQNLPAGCIVVWNKGEGHPYGHITVTLGNNKAASDHIEDFDRTVKTHPQEFAVFIPVDNKKTSNKA